MIEIDRSALITSSNQAMLVRAVGAVGAALSGWSWPQK